MYYIEEEAERREQRHKYDARSDFRNYALGKIVMTKYNNRNYRVDDVDWDSNPRSTFPQMRGGVQVEVTVKNKFTKKSL